MIFLVKIMFVNKVSYLVGISQHSKITMEMTENQKQATRVVASKQIISTNLKGAFMVMDVQADNQFGCVGGALEDLGACLNI